MATNIGPDPVTISLGVTGSRTGLPQQQSRPSASLGAASDSPAAEAAAQHAGPAAPAMPPAEAFVAAVESAKLPPEPISATEAFRRIARNWAPPHSDLTLTDRTV